MNLDMLRAIATLISFILFIGIACWAWSRRAQPGFREAANLPFALDDDAADFNGRSRT